MIQEVEYLYAQQRSVVDGKKGAKCPQWEEEEGLAGVCPTSSEPSVHKPYSAILCHSVSHSHTYTHVTWAMLYSRMYTLSLCIVSLHSPSATLLFYENNFSQRNDDGNVKKSISG